VVTDAVRAEEAADDSVVLSVYLLGHRLLYLLTRVRSYMWRTIDQLVPHCTTKSNVGDSGWPVIGIACIMKETWRSVKSPPQVCYRSEFLFYTILCRHLGRRPEIPAHRYGLSLVWHLTYCLLDLYS
jgi:hypothetical protein